MVGVRIGQSLRYSSIFGLLGARGLDQCTMLLAAAATLSRIVRSASRSSLAQSAVRGGIFEAADTIFVFQIFATGRRHGRMARLSLSRNVQDQGQTVVSSHHGQGVGAVSLKRPNTTPVLLVRESQQ